MKDDGWVVAVCLGVTLYSAWKLGQLISLEIEHAKREEARREERFAHERLMMMDETRERFGETSAFAKEAAAKHAEADARARFQAPAHVAENGDKEES